MMEKAQKKTPNLRFKGFTDNWEQRKLGDVVKITMGQSPNGSSYHDKPIGEILVQGNADLQNGYVKPRIWTTQITKEANKGDIIMSVRAPAGEVGKTNYHVVIGRGVAAIKGNEFIYHLLSKMNANSYWKKYSTGSTFESLNSNTISNAEIILPSLKEQQKIGIHFKRLDHLITLHQRKLALLKQLKKGLLQKMFADNDQEQPSLRFKGFTGDWEQHKLGDLGSVQMNKRIFKDQTSESGEVPFFKIGTFGKKPDSFITKKLFDEYKSKYPYPEVGDILISASGSIGRTVVYKGEDAYFQDSNIVWLEHDSRLKNSFLEQFLKRTKWNKIEGSTIKRLYNKDILNKKINLPDQQEQSTIGNFFKQLDFLITLHQQKLNKLNNLKQGLLQQMFI